jgi:NAD(P)-dependent dehydrogenase (short-subunit alcohol dehydrogenase family)
MKKVLVLGGTGDLGSAIVKKYLDANCYVVIHGSSINSLSKVNLTSFPKNRYEFITMNSNQIGNPPPFNLSTLDKIDIFINACGGAGEHKDWNSTSLDHWAKVYESNVLLPVFFIKKILPSMKNRKIGIIINIGSVAGIKALSVGPEYSAAKAAIIKLTESLAKECGSYGINVNCINPGLIQTRKLEAHLKTSAQCNKNISLPIDLHATKIFPNLMGYLPNPNDVADLVLFLSSPAASSITGQNLTIDSGYSLSNYPPL